MTKHDTEAALELLAAAAAPAEEAQALPFAAYRDEGLFALELDRVFRSDWVAVCAEAALAEPGDYLAIDIAGEPLALVRGADGQLRALSNVCRHRGTLMLEPGVDCLDGGTITCPYHAWSYSDSGAFRGAPYTHGITIDREEHSLPAFRVEVWMGVVFVCLSADAPPLAERLADIAPHLAEFDMESFAVPGPLAAPEIWEANWKLIVENGMESYHLFKVHEKTLEKVTPTRGAYYIEGSAPWTLTGGEIVQGDGGVVGKLLGSLFGGGTGGDHYVLVSIPPSFVGVVTQDSWDWIIAHPVSPTSTRGLPGNADAFRPRPGDAGHLGRLCDGVPGRGPRDLRAGPGGHGGEALPGRAAGSPRAGGRGLPSLPRLASAGAETPGETRGGEGLSFDRRQGRAVGGGVRWLTLGALAIVVTAVVFNFQWLWGLLFLYWAVPALATGVTFLVEPIYRDQNPWLYWIIVTMWTGLSLALIGIDLAQLAT